MNITNMVVSLNDTRYEHNRVMQPGNDPDMFSFVFHTIEWNTSAPWRDNSIVWKLADLK